MPSTRRDRRFGLATSVAVKAPATVASTGVLVLFGSTQLIDGAIRSTGERVMVNHQSNSTITGSTLNGIYEIRNRDWQRTADCDGFPDLIFGTVVFVTTGSTTNDQGGRFFSVDSTTSVDGFIRPGTDAMRWNQLDALLNPFAISTGEVTLAMMADVNSPIFLGRNTASSGVPEEITLPTARNMIGGIADNITDIVIDHGADPTGIVDASTRIQDAINTRKSVYGPPGRYKTSTQLDFLHVNSTDTSRGQLFYGAGQDVTFIVPTTDFPSTSKVFNLGTGEPAPQIYDLNVAYTSTAPATRAGLPTQPDAIYVDVSPRAEIVNVKITKGMNGIIFAGNSGGALIKNAKLSCFEKNIQIDGCLDTMRLKDIHVWPFEIVNDTDYTNIFYDSIGRALDIGRCDGLVVEGMTTFGPATYLRVGTTETGSTSAGAGAFASFTDCDFDHWGGLYAEIGNISVSCSVFTIGSSLARHAINLGATSDHRLEFNLSGSYLHSAKPADPAGPAPNDTLISHAQGVLNVNGCHFDLADTPTSMRAIVQFTGGDSSAISMNVTGNTIAHRASTAITAVVADGLEPAVIVSNKFRNFSVPITESTGAGNRDKNIIGLNEYGSTLAVGLRDFMQLRNISSTRSIVNYQTDNDGAASGPIINIIRKSASAANGDLGGDIRFLMDTANGTGEIMGRIINTIVDNTDGAESGEIEIQTPIGGVLSGRLGIANGIQVGDPTGGYQGDGTVNSTGYYVNGVLVGTGSGTVTGVLGTAPIVSDGNSVTPTITINAASESARGAVRIATNVETLSPTSTTIVLSPQDMAAWWVAPPSALVLGSVTPRDAKVANLNSSAFAAHHGSNTAVAVEGFSTSTSYTGIVILAHSQRTASASYNLFAGYSGDLGDKEFQVTGAGEVTADGSFTGGGADYAEFFEWDDGNAKNEDRRGHSVVLLPNGNIMEARRGDRNLIGIVSGNPTLIGNAAELRWHGKYQRDRFGAYILSSHGHRWRNREYNAKKIYIPRADRQEWGCVGLVGRLRLVKGQPTDPRWLYMGNISKSIEEWLVR